MKHTKGEWNGKDSEVYSLETGKTIARCDIGGRDEETEANALIMASAPEMIKFIHEVALFLNTHQHEDKKILKGYTLAANLGEKATEFITRAAYIVTKATQL